MNVEKTMTIPELLRRVFEHGHSQGREWFTVREAKSAVAEIDSARVTGGIRTTITAYCINDPTNGSYPTRQKPSPYYLNNPLFVTLNPQDKRDRKYRLLSETERSLFRSQPRHDLRELSYNALMMWLSQLIKLQLRSPSVGLQGLSIEYSPEDDYLHVTIGEPRSSEAVSNTSEINHVILFDPDSFELTALEVPFFLEQLRKTGRDVGFWSYVASLIERSGSTIYIPPAAEGEQAELALSKLLAG